MGASVLADGRLPRDDHAKDAVISPVLRQPWTAPPPAETAVAAERELVRRCLAHDPQAWRALYDAHQARVARLVAALGIVDGEAADLCQEIFIIVYRHLRGFRGDARLSTWIHRLAVREAIRHARRGRARRALLRLVARDDVVRMPRDLVENAAARRQFLAQVLSRLPAERRLALVLFEVEGRSVHEIAELCGCAVNTVWTRIHRARTQLEQLARQEDEAVR
jgi:RNA polymerase sigma-70 factor (ECF subfamily)